MTPEELAREVERLTATVFNFSEEISNLRRDLDQADRDNARLREALEGVDKASNSHIDGRDLFEEIHPRNELDIRRRMDGVDTWHEADWLTNLWRAIKYGRNALSQSPGPRVQASAADASQMEAPSVSSPLPEPGEQTVRGEDRSARAVSLRAPLDASPNASLSNSNTVSGPNKLPHRPAYWTSNEDGGDYHRAYYFAPTDARPPPYLEQREVAAIIDVAADGTLAGVELIFDDLPPAPALSTPQAEAEAGPRPTPIWPEPLDHKNPWVHVKGGRYWIESEALDEATLEPLVIYRRMHRPDSEGSWVRTRKNFLERFAPSPSAQGKSE